jgi:simple sugar transport system ATP-binding protein
MHQPIVQLKSVTKRFPGVVANEQVSLDLYPGEVHSLLGENGAGKTTLMSILAGLYQPDEGEVLVQGRRVHFRSAQDAIRHGIDMVHQHFQLVKSFTVAENIILGQPSSRGPLVEDRRKVGERIRQLSQQYRLDVNPDAQVWQLSVGEQQRVEILKALYRGADVLVLDEPTAVLTPQEATDLLAIVRTLAGQGRAIVFISHKLNEVLAVSDRVTVLRNGRVVGSVQPRQEAVTTSELARLMVGREVLPVVARKGHTPGEERLFIEGLWVHDDRNLPAVRGIDLTVRAGEIVGLAGVAGNGQRELEEALRGLRLVTRGRIRLGAQELTYAPPRARIASRFAHIPADRYGWGLLSSASVAENLVLETFESPPYTRRGLLDYVAINATGAQLVQDYDVRTPSVTSRAGKLSGGNAQKLVLARELAREPQVLLAAQPTRGLDIGAISYVHQRLIEQRDRGVAILLISTELDEIFALSDRIAVLYEGQIIGVTPGDNAYRRHVGLMMAGVREEQTG